MTSDLRDGNILAARTKLENAINRLTRKRPAIYHDTTVYVPDLYTSLRNDLAGTPNNTTKTQAKSQPPLWIDNLQLLKTIDNQTHQWMPVPGTTPQRLQLLAAKTWRPQDTQHVTRTATTINTWSDNIINLLDPQPTKTIDAPCPSCNQRWVRRNSAGEIVRKPALQIVLSKGCTCLACDETWAPDRYRHLANQLGITPGGEQ